MGCVLSCNQKPAIVGFPVGRSGPTLEQLSDDLICKEILPHLAHEGPTVLALMKTSRRLRRLVRDEPEGLHAAVKNSMQNVPCDVQVPAALAEKYFHATAAARQMLTERRRPAIQTLTMRLDHFSAAGTHAILREKRRSYLYGTHAMLREKRRSCLNSSPSGKFRSAPEKQATLPSGKNWKDFGLSNQGHGLVASLRGAANLVPPFRFIFALRKQHVTPFSRPLSIDAPFAIAWSPNGSHLAALYRDELRCYNVQDKPALMWTSPSLRAALQDHPLTLKWSSDGAHLLSSSTGWWQVHDARQGHVRNKHTLGATYSELHWLGRDAILALLKGPTDNDRLTLTALHLGSPGRQSEWPLHDLGNLEIEAHTYAAHNRTITWADRSSLRVLTVDAAGRNTALQQMPKKFGYRALTIVQSPQAEPMQFAVTLRSWLGWGVGLQICTKNGQSVTHEFSHGSDIECAWIAQGTALAVLIRGRLSEDRPNSIYHLRAFDGSSGQQLAELDYGEAHWTPQQKSLVVLPGGAHIALRMESGLRIIHLAAARNLPLADELAFSAREADDADLESLTRQFHALRHSYPFGN